LHARSLEDVRVPKSEPTFRRVVLLTAIATAAAAAASLARAGAPSAATSRGWERADLKPVSQPAPVADRVVLYVARSRALWVVGLDASTGKTIWSARASTSGNAPGSAPALAVIGQDVYFFAPAGGGTAALVAHDAHQGSELWRRRAFQFNSFPYVCPGRTTAVCVTAADVAAGGTEQARFDGASGKPLGHALVSTTSNARELAVGLFDPGTRTPERLVATQGSRVAWRRPLSVIFTLRGASTDWGWNFDRLDRADLFVGSAGAAPVRQTRTRALIDLSRAMTAGFRIRDGAVVWRSRGSYACSYVPCAGAAESAFSSPANVSGEPTVGVRSLERGTVSVATNGNSLPVPARSARIAFEGFAPRTGRTLWRYDVGHVPALITEAALPARLSRTSIALVSRNQAVALDVATGAHHAIATSTRAWCRHIVLYKQSAAYHAGNGHALTTYVGQYALSPCTAAGRRLAAPPRVPAFVGAIGARAGGLVAWSDTGAVFARPSGG
jgi:hypothetical protein